MARHPEFNAENADEIIKFKIGQVFAQVLECAGVYKVYGRGRECPETIPDGDSEWIKFIIFPRRGRTEIGGNHTDHQHGCVLAAAVDMETTAEVALNGTNVIRVDSEGYKPVEIDLNDLTIKEDEKNTTAALIRGVAAFEALIGRILNGLFANGAVPAIEIAQIGQYAENVYFGKPCGLMDQMASSVGGLVFIDFVDPKRPTVEKVDYDFTHCGYTPCIIDSGADHADLTAEYAAIPAEMKSVAAYFGKAALRDVDEREFYAKIVDVRKTIGDRAVLRAMHFFDENRRVQMQVHALKNDNFAAFLNYANESGNASWELLQNITPLGATTHQEMALTLALCWKLLGGEGAVRVHGGGFAGTVLAFVPNEKFGQFKNAIDSAIGNGRTQKLHR